MNTFTNTPNKTSEQHGKGTNILQNGIKSLHYTNNTNSNKLS